ncbi:hypothetical protein AKJ39_04655 [candidate division MSBL1 archaeon SCGC-AAA259J03]|uniref:DUF3368 domain-containing protein n=1 Tax=candidate division MSBL1 archaeon SCGC-AAA259J03 TaxID=1698269 RepID=A0A656YUY6_9EURY|nr:hypothetical protein AKJ39_04655 [candidate division MSBL1 archaeon SCGC-AAA259J03]
MKDSRTFIDASTIIALASIGELNFLKKIFKEINITPHVRSEILVENYPETNRISEAIGEWMKVIEINENNLKKYEKHGLGKGESSIIDIARKDDRLVLDDPVARNVAKVNGLNFTGLIGLIVEASHAGLISSERGKKILDKLSSSDFRMTSELYNWAIKRL